MSDNEPSVHEDFAVQTAAMNLFHGCAPERASELATLWKLLDPKFRVVPDTHQGERFILDAGAYRYVRFNHRAVRAFWLSAFAAREGYRVVAESTDLGNVDLQRLSGLICAFEQVLTSDKPDLEPLPAGGPEPGTYPDLASAPQARAAAELATIATGWALLHEVRHIQHQRDGTGADPYADDPAPFHSEEISCDSFATAFLLDKIDEYAISTSSDVKAVRRKREIAIYFVMFTLVLLAKPTWASTRTHPSIQDRLNAVAAQLGPERDEIAAAIAHTAFAALRSLWPDAPGVVVNR
jgi:hypothetical protein